MGDRPVGLTVLAVLHLLGGLFLCALTMLLGGMATAMGPALGVAKVIIVLSMLIVVIVPLASAVGIFIGERWGWWVSAYFYVHAISQNLQRIFLAGDVGAALGVQIDQAENLRVVAVRSLISVLILMYLFQPKVLDYFNIVHDSRWKSLGILVGVHVALVIFVTIVNLLFG